MGASLGKRNVAAGDDDDGVAEDDRLSARCFGEEYAYAPPQWASCIEAPPPSRIALGTFPTPIAKWELPGVPEGVELYIKRDDLTGLGLSGNKVRKLEFLMAEARKQGADCVITIGGIQSNHCRATALAAKYLGLDAHLILRTSAAALDDDPGLQGNLLLDRMLGAKLYLVSKGQYVRTGSVALGEMLEAKLRQEGRRPFVIPVGGSNGLGTWGYVDCVAEMQEQLAGGRRGACAVRGVGAGGRAFDDVVLASGSGGTAAGLALGVRLSGLAQKVHAYGVCDDPDYFYDYIDHLFQALGAPPEIVSRDVVLCKQAKGLGYAMSTDEEVRAVQEIAEATGILLDPVYSGKAVVNMLKDMQASPEEWRGRRVLFVHTGGLLGMYEKESQMLPHLKSLNRVQKLLDD